LIVSVAMRSQPLVTIAGRHASGLKK